MTVNFRGFAADLIATKHKRKEEWKHFNINLKVIENTQNDVHNIYYNYYCYDIIIGFI